MTEPHPTDPTERTERTGQRNGSTAVATEQPTARRFARRWPDRLRIVGRDALRTFLVQPVRSNVIRSHGGGITAATSLTIGTLAFVVASAGVVFGPTLATINAAGGRAGAIVSSRPGDPLVVPSFFVPTLFVLLTVGCSLALFGAVLARPAIAAAAGVFVLLAAGTPAAVSWGMTPGLLSRLGLVLLLASLVAVAVMRRWRPPLPVIQLVTVLGSAGAILPAYLTVMSQARAQQGSLGGYFAYSVPDTIVGQVSLLTTPVVFLAGIAVVGFGITVTAFVRRSAVLLTRSVASVVLAVVAALLIVRSVYTVIAINDRVSAHGAGVTSAAIAVTAAVIAGAAFWWRWAAGGSLDPEKGSAGGQVAMVGLLIGLTLASGVLVTLAYLVSLVLRSSEAISWLNGVVDWIGLPIVTNVWRLGLDAGVVIWATIRARRAPGPLPGWVGLVGGLDLVRKLCSVISPTWGVLRPVEMDVVVVLAIAVRAAILLARRRAPRPGEAVTAGSLMLLTALIAQGSFLSDPFAPILGFTGIGFVLFGVVWGFLTSGAHASARGVSGLGRTLIMLGYAIVPTALLAWQQASHAGYLTAAVAGGTGSSGQAYLGDPLLLALIAGWLPIVLGRPARRRQLTQGTPPDVASGVDTAVVVDAAEAIDPAAVEPSAEPSEPESLVPVVGSP